MRRRSRALLGFGLFSCLIFLVAFTRNNLTIPVDYHIEYVFENEAYTEDSHKLLDAVYEVLGTRVPAEEAIAMTTHAVTAELKLLSKPPIDGSVKQAVIFTTWRSGSTFLGEALSAHPASYYHYEPLLHFGVKQVREGQALEKGLQVVSQLLKCDYSNLDDYLKMATKDEPLWRNHRLFKFCKKNRKLCKDPKFLSAMCKIFPYQTMKNVRLRLAASEEIVKDNELNTKIILLIRDPRGTLVSRKRRTWCPGKPDCDQPSILCQDLVDDYFAAIDLIKKYPKRYMILRYEDLSLNLDSELPKVFDFLDMEFHDWVKDYVKKHTGKVEKQEWSTFRDPKSTPFHWVEYFKEPGKLEELRNIEEACYDAMNIWNYVPIADIDPKNWETVDLISKPNWPQI